MNHADPQSGEPTEAGQPGVQGRFVWPPRRPAPPTGDDDRGPTPVSAPPLSFWEEIEREWFGVVTPPLHRRLADAKAAPDAINAYCWRCGRTVGPYETDAKGCSKCRGTRPHWTRFVRVAEYRSPWDRIVHNVKFTKWPRLGVDLGVELGRQIERAVPDIADLPTIVVPVPTNYFRRIARGTDHSLNLARGVGQHLGIPVRQLLRRAHRPEQAKLPASDRLTNLQNSMGRAGFDRVLAGLKLGRAARWPQKRDSARVLLVDDISTTGATLGEAARTVKNIAKSMNIKDLDIIACAVCRTEERR